MSDDILDLKDLVISVLLQSSDGYKPLVIKRKFEAMARVLAKQAYWLAWLESMEKMADKLEAVQFKGLRIPGLEIQTPLWRPGHTPTLRDHASFERARKRALSKLHGKHAPAEHDFLAQSFGGAWHFDQKVGAASIDSIISSALGPQLGSYRVSTRERGEFEKLLWESPSDKEAFKSSKPRL